MNPRSSSTSRVGQFLKEQREKLGISQRALGLLFNPPVTTQFISNIERGITPLPIAHIGTLVTHLKLREGDLLRVLEEDFSEKITHQISASTVRPLWVRSEYFDFLRQFSDFFENSNSETQEKIRVILKSMKE